MLEQQHEALCACRKRAQHRSKGPVGLLTSGDARHSADRNTFKAIVFAERGQ